MKPQSINVLGYTGNNSQFVVKTLNTDLRINQNAQAAVPGIASPYEYILAGFAGCINALGQLVAAELGINLKSLQIEITGSLNTDVVSGISGKVRPGFNSIEIVLKPAAAAPLETLQRWMKEVRFRSPLYDNLVNNTPVKLNLFKEYTAVN
ncbi:hypothetical protein Q765_03695 [Flavobacterium rivuli WB 3.3-2 = DSM 21788]|uniref:Osmotically inducible protein C n=1 Tax=Flavobacterium rivuli WB 3.3-2 = DSM 21788 TaxID=1121895 RepID=A0A0A2M981_9FLAO|nr:OsmC family protein [Flavobacterium rivuli]KGO88161.1 hypothetical protein Q765_03695 [Flavobacterium rivuli WB 3.3-2 = DSM 21788]